MSNFSVKKSKIAVIGLGYVGLPVAVEFGKIRSVLGFDLNADRVKELQSGLDRTRECSPETLLSSVNLKFSADENELGPCGVYIVAVPTPIDESNRPDLKHLQSASEIIGKQLKVGDLVIYESTVFPGATEEFCVPILEQVSGLTFNVDFFCGYSPERINPSDKVNTFTVIKKVVSGSTDEVAKAVDELYSEVVSAGTWRASSIRVAEASKVIENSQRDLNIAFVNELSVIFERLGIDTLEVLEAAGSKWNFLPFRPGLVGGHCIGVDPYYLTHKAEAVGYIPQIILSGRRMNDNMARYAARNLAKLISSKGQNLSQSTVGVMGVTFKEDCPDIRNSKVFDMIKEFESWGVTVVASDAWANIDEVQDHYGVRLVQKIEPGSCDALVVTVGHKEFRSMSPADLRNFCKNDRTIVLGDLKSLYDRGACENVGFDVFRL